MAEYMIEAYKIESWWKKMRPEVVRQLGIFRRALPTAESAGGAEGILYKAYIDRLQRWLSLGDSGPAALGDPPAGLRDEILELHSWIFANADRGDPRLGKNKLGEMFVESGFGFERTQTLLEEAPKQKGRPPKHHIDIEAYDRSKMLGWSHKQITAKLCDCGKSKHGPWCQDHIRKGIKRVEKLLGKYRGAPATPHLRK